MGRTQSLIKEKFDSYFNRLKDIAETIEELKDALNGCDPAVQQEMRRHICHLEDELKGYAEELKSGGTEIIKRVA